MRRVGGGQEGRVPEVEEERLEDEDEGMLRGSEGEGGGGTGRQGWVGSLGWGGKRGQRGNRIAKLEENMKGKDKSWRKIRIRTWRGKNEGKV